MSSLKSNKKIALLGVILLAVVALVLSLALSGSSSAEAEAAAPEVPKVVEHKPYLAPISEADSAKFDAAVAALNTRNGDAKALIDNTAGKVLDDNLRVALSNDYNAAVALALTPKPGSQLEVARVLGEFAKINAAYDASAAAVSDNHNQWVIATTPPPPAPKANNGGGTKKPSSSGGGGGGSKKPSGSGGGGGGGYGGPSGGGGSGWQDADDSSAWDKPVTPGTVIE